MQAKIVSCLLTNACTGQESVDKIWSTRNTPSRISHRTGNMRMRLVSGPLVGSGWVCWTSTQSPTRSSSTLTVGRCAGGGVITVVRGGGANGALVVCVAVVELGNDGDWERLAVNSQITSAITASTMITYERVSPTIARSRPRCPRCLICESATWARAAPAGANTNANTIDKVASVLTSPLGVPCGGGKTEPVGAGKPWVSGGGVYPWMFGGPPKGSGWNGSGWPPSYPPCVI